MFIFQSNTDVSSEKFDRLLRKLDHNDGRIHESHIKRWDYAKR